MTMRAAMLTHGLLACSLIAKQFRATTTARSPIPATSRSPAKRLAITDDLRRSLTLDP
jgi:hypothetical protein